MERTGVLLVDDDLFVLRLLEAVFRRRGIEVTTAASAEEALALVEDSPPELILADVMMPGMSGYELCRRVRALGLDDLPFLFCSALGDLADRVTGLKAGADDYILKPVNTEELVLRVSSHLERIRHIRRLRQVTPVAEFPAGKDVLSGQIGALGLADVLQVAALLRRGPLVVRLGQHTTAEAAVWLEGARLVQARVGDQTGRGALLRLLQWPQGTFRIEDGAFTGVDRLDALVDEAILGGLAEIDELRALRDGLPAPALRVVRRAAAVRRRFDEPLAEVLALVELDGRVDAVLAASSRPEIETLRAVAALAAEGFLAAA